MTRDELVAMVRQQADAEDASRWSDGEVLAATDVTFRREWNNILDSAPYARINVVTVNTDANGVLDFDDLTTGTGDSAKVFNNLIQLSDGTNIFKETRADLIAPDGNGSAMTLRYLFYQTGDSFQVLPATTTSMRAVVNWTPVAPLDLVDGDSAVDFPADGLMVLAMAAAALLLAKGGTETTEAASLLNLASQLRDDMLDSIRRRTNMPKFMRYPDSAREWSSR